MEILVSDRFCILKEIFPIMRHYKLRIPEFL